MLSTRFASPYFLLVLATLPWLGACGPSGPSPDDTSPSVDASPLIGGSAEAAATYPKAIGALAKAGNEPDTFSLTCTATVIEPPGAPDDAPSIVLTAAHCLSKGQRWFSTPLALAPNTADPERLQNKLDAQVSYPGFRGGAYHHFTYDHIARLRSWLNVHRSIESGHRSRGAILRGYLDELQRCAMAPVGGPQSRCHAAIANPRASCRMLPASPAERARCVSMLDFLDTEMPGGTVPSPRMQAYLKGIYEGLGLPSGSGDVALGRLERPFVEAEPLRLATESSDAKIQTGAPLFAVGYGSDDPSTSFFNPYSGVPTRRAGPVKVVYDSRAAIQLAGAWANDAGSDHASKCKGDSGGPTLSKDDDGHWTVVGVTSHVATGDRGGAFSGCDNDTVDARVWGFNDWLLEESDLLIRGYRQLVIPPRWAERVRYLAPLALAHPVMPSEEDMLKDATEESVFWWLALQPIVDPTDASEVDEAIASCVPTAPACYARIAAAQRKRVETIVEGWTCKRSAEGCDVDAQRRGVWNMSHLTYLEGRERLLAAHAVPNVTTRAQWTDGGQQDMADFLSAERPQEAALLTALAEELAALAKQEWTRRPDYFPHVWLRTASLKFGTRVSDRLRDDGHFASDVEDVLVRVAADVLQRPVGTLQRRIRSDEALQERFIEAVVTKSLAACGLLGSCE